MTEFSELEQEMLRKMVQLHKSQNLCINSWLSKLFNDKISLKHIPGKLLFEYQIDIEYFGVEQDELLSKIKYFQFLVERLENAYLIKRELLGNAEFKFDELEAKEVYSLIAYSNNGLLYNFFSVFGNSPILVSQYIIELVENNFQTSEQIRFEKQLRKAKVQIWLAWAAFIVACITLLFQFCTETRIDNDQINQIKQTIEQKTLPEVIKTEVINDTLITRIVDVPKAQTTKQK